MNKIEGILNRLKKVKESGPGQWTALCPAHSDRHPSLSIKNGDDGRILLKCHAGCRTEDVVSAIGFEMKNLFPDKEYLPGKPSKPVKQNPQSKDLGSYWDNLRRKYINRTPLYNFLEEKRKIGRKTIDAAIKDENISFYKLYNENVLAARFCGLDNNKTMATIQYISMTDKLLSNDTNKLFKEGTIAGKGFFQAGTNIEDADTVVIFESVIDALSNADVKPEECSLAIGGTQLVNKVKALRKYRDQGKKIVTFMDNDQAGHRATQKIAKILGQKVLNVKWDADTPNKYDVNDLLQDSQRDVIIQMIEDATHDPEYGLIGEVKSTREELTRRIEQIDDIDRLLGPIARDVAQSGLPITHILALRKIISKKAGVTVKSLEQDAGERKIEGGSSDNSKLNHLKIAEQVINRYGIENIIYFGGLIYLWRNTGVWKKANDQEVKQKIHNIIGDNENINQSVISSILSMLQTKAFLPDHRFDISTDTINCLNGELEWTKEEGWTLTTHDRKNYRTSQIPITYDPKAKAPRFGQFLSEIFKKDSDKLEKAALVCEICGYVLLSSCRYEKFILFLGPGANGKSVLMRTVEALVGSENVCAVQPSQLNNRFQRAHLHTKLVNVVTEIAEGYKISDAEIKAISSGELITAEHKNKAPFDFYPFSTLLFGTNHMPHTRDFSEALFRRAIIIPFNQIFSEQEQDKHLIDKLKKELPGILNMALSGLENVFLRGGFIRTDGCEKVKKRWRLESDQAAQFAEDCCEFGPDFYESSKDIYENYQKWAEENGIRKKLNKKNLTLRLVRLGAEQNRKTGGLRVLSGIKLVT